MGSGAFGSGVEVPVGSGCATGVGIVGGAGGIGAGTTGGRGTAGCATAGVGVVQRPFWQEVLAQSLLESHDAPSARARFEHAPISADCATKTASQVNGRGERMLLRVLTARTVPGRSRRP